MSANAQAIRAMISAFSGERNTLSIPISFIRFTGSLEGGALLSQIVYWGDRTKDPEGWFYKNYEEWQEEILLSKFQVSRHTKSFQSYKIIETKIKKVKGAPTRHYRINWDVFTTLFSNYLQTGKSLSDLVESEEIGLSRNFTLESEETELSESEETELSNVKKLNFPLYTQIILTDPTTDPTYIRSRARETDQRIATEEISHSPEVISTSQVPCQTKSDPGVKPEASSGEVSSAAPKKSREDYFDEFWQVYPRKVGRPKARGYFDKVPDQVLPKLAESVERQKRAYRRLHADGWEYFPYPATWLNQGRWDDEVEGDAPANNHPARNIFTAPTAPEQVIDPEFRRAKIREILGRSQARCNQTS